MWGLAWGDMGVAMTAELEDAVDDAGLDWTADWEPYVFAGYIYWDLAGSAWELDYSFGYEVDCGELTRDSSGDNVKLSAPSSGPLSDGVYTGQSWTVFYADNLIP